MSDVQFSKVIKVVSDTFTIGPIDLSIKRGEFFSLLGPSGCGKSTLLRLLAGFVLPDSGDIFIDSNNVTLLPAEKRRAPMVFQNYALWPHMSVGENISFGLEMHGYPTRDREARVAEALKLVQLDAFSKRLPRELSGGQQQRVALARALALNPSLILMDEPLSDLDARLRVEMRSEIRSLQKKLGCTVMYVTHDHAEALSMADTVAVMMNGQIVDGGAPREIYESPRRFDVARFFGELNVRRVIVKERSGSEVTFSENPGLFRGRTNTEKVSAQSPACACIRPDRLHVSDPPKEIGAHFEGIVETVAYEGDREVMTVEQTGTKPLLVTHPAGGASFKIGDRIRVWADAKDVLVFSEAECAI